jgi:hypothetical protein
MVLVFLKPKCVAAWQATQWIKTEIEGKALAVYTHNMPEAWIEFSKSHGT